MSYSYDPHTYNDRAARQVVPVLMKLFHPGSVADVGCGLGTWLRVFKEHGVHDITGMDQPGDVPGRLIEEFIPADLCQPLNLERRFDLVLCLEVAEHLQPACSAQLVDTLTSLSDHIIFSAAIPGQGGQKHIHEQPPAYWEKLFNQRGYHYHDILRPRFWNNEEIDWWYRQNIFVVSNRMHFETEDLEFPQSNFYIHPVLFDAYRKKLLAAETENKGVNVYLRLLIHAIKNKLIGK